MLNWMWILFCIGTASLKTIGSSYRLSHAFAESDLTLMIACMRFQTKSDKADEMMKAVAEYIRDHPFTESLHMDIIDLGTGEFALIGVHNSVDAFVDIMNRDFYEGYSMNFEDKCNAEVKLKTYSSLLNIFKVNICTNQSEIISERV